MGSGCGGDGEGMSKPCGRKRHCLSSGFFPVNAERKEEDEEEEE